MGKEAHSGVHESVPVYHPREWRFMRNIILSPLLFSSTNLSSELRKGIFSISSSHFLLNSFVVQKNSVILSLVNMR